MKFRWFLDNALELPAAHLSNAEAKEQRMARTHWQHREIIAVLKSRNPAWAEAQMTAHLFWLVLPPDPGALGTTMADDIRNA